MGECEIIMLMNEIDKRLSKFNSCFEYTVSFCRVGSSLKNVISKDLDYLWIVSNKEAAKRNILNLEEMKKVNWIDDSVRFTYMGVVCNIAIYDVREMENKIEQIINCVIFGEMREWALGYWIPEGFLYDLMQSLVLLDNEEWLNEKRKYIEQNMCNFRRKIYKRVLKEIDYDCKRIKKESPFISVIQGKLFLSLLRLCNISNDWKQISFDRIYQKVKESEYSNEFEILLETDLSDLESVVLHIVKNIGEAKW